MAGPIPTKKIPQLTAYETPLSGPEQLEIWVADTSRRVTARDFALPIDPFVMAVDMSSTHPMSRYLASSASVTVIDNGPGQPITLNTADGASLPTGLQTYVVPGPGTINNFPLSPSIGFLDIDTTLGEVTITGISPGADGQILIVSNTGANLMNLSSLGAGSLAANRIRLAVDLTYVQRGSQTLRYSNTLALWVPMS